MRVEGGRRRAEIESRRGGGHLNFEVRPLLLEAPPSAACFLVSYGVVEALTCAGRRQFTPSRTAMDKSTDQFQHGAALAAAETSWTSAQTGLCADDHLTLCFTAGAHPSTRNSAPRALHSRRYFWLEYD